MLRRSGPGDLAEAEAVAACEELRPWMRREFGWPLVELGTIRLRRGDLAGAEELLRKWRASNDRINAYISVGDYQAATQIALGSGEDDSTPAFGTLDAALSEAIEESRSQLRTDIVNARRVLSGTTVGAAALSVIAVLAVTLGLWPRLSEYR